jgi:hypothetical protein
MKNTTFVGALLAVILISSAAIGVAWTIRNIDFNLPGIFGWNRTIQTQTENQTQPDDYDDFAAPPTNTYTHNYTAFIQPETVKTLCKSIIDSNKTILENLGTLYNYVLDNIEYAYDNDTHPGYWDYWQTPTQTLQLKKGDCEDMSILLLSLIKAYKPDLNAWLISIFSTTPSGVGHSAVVVSFEQNVTILDVAGGYYTGDYIMTIKPDGVSWSGGTETITAKPTEQEMNQWLAFWNVLGVESARVTRALNDQEEFSFDNNSDFITFLEDEK